MDIATLVLQAAVEHGGCFLRLDIAPGAPAVKEAE
jgi:hypothetical protein